MTNKANIILAVESAIRGGSISLLKDGVEIANWIGASNVSKAEDLLFNIDEILKSNDISRHDINLVAVSAGPGSFTGIRIGLATALGLKAGLGIAMASGSALKAMAFGRADGSLIAALPVGRNSVCVQRFTINGGEVSASDEPTPMPEDEFFELVQNENGTNLVLHDSLYEKCEPTPNIMNFGANIAFAIGSMCSMSPGVVIEPLFISKSV